ncbi:pilus assembly protein, partial [Pseudomonadota bacterium]
MKTRIIQNTTTQRLLAGCMSLLLTASALAAPEFTPDSQPTGWISRPVVTLQDLSSGKESFYQLDYRKNTWAGNVLAKYVSSTARIQTTGPWDDDDPTMVTPSSLLDKRGSGDRIIVTIGSPFDWDFMTDTEREALGSRDILDYVRGDRSNEEPDGLSLRLRESVLGDIQHSTIYYWADKDKVNETLFVGANDGMLHVFDAKTGAENFAYVPSMLIPKLDKLAAKPYVHTHFVDGPISVANMEVDGGTKAILVGGLGAGGAGLYALDVTTTTASGEADAAAKVMWEITPATSGFGDLGHTYGTPMLTKLPDADRTAAVIVGNGYMNAGSGNAVLYIINAVTGDLISAIDTESGSDTEPNGLSSPTLYDVDGDLVPEYAFAGDIDGNMWKFDLIKYTSEQLFITSPVQPITSAPAAHSHPLGGIMVAFATGQILTTGDPLKKDIHYVYGIWDGAPDANNQLLVQTLSSSTYGTGAVRTVTDNVPNWTEGSGHHMGWRVALPPGERVVGEKPFYNNGRFYFLSTNPALESTENWLHELVFNTGGSPLGPIYDLNQDDEFNGFDLASNGEIPVAKFLGNGVFSQPLLVNAEGLSTTLYAYHPDLPYGDGVPTPPDDPGVSGGHFDFDIYYPDPPPAKSTGIDDEQTRSNICASKKAVDSELEEISATYCTAANGFDLAYGFMTDYSENSTCGDKLNYFDITCSTFTTDGEYGDYAKVKHVHEYDDKYDVTGVNMLNASDPVFNLANAILDVTTEFKVLVMNQYLNPAAKLSVGASTALPSDDQEVEGEGKVGYESVRTYANLASETSAANLLGPDGLKTYNRGNVGTLIFNLPLDAFKSKNWWGDEVIRAGLIPTKTGCVNNINEDGSMKDTGRNGVPGPNGERFNGALTIQLIKADTPPGHIEINHLDKDARYGWRVIDQFFTDHVLVEYTVFWHHPNGACYGEDNWVKDPPEHYDPGAKGGDDRAAGSADPRDGVFTAGLAILGTDITVDGLVTTTT